MCVGGKFGAEAQDTVALLVGGIDDNEEAISGVELFGCPGRESTPVDDYPIPIFLTGGLYYQPDPDDISTGRALVCGGLSRNEDGLRFDVTECYEWRPDGQWTDSANLLETKWGHLMALAVDLETQSEALVPMALGLNTNVFVYKPEDDRWSRYSRDLPNAPWATFECLLQKDAQIYQITNNAVLLNTTDWIYTPLYEVPDALNRPGRCAYTEIDGVPGKKSTCVHES